MAKGKMTMAQYEKTSTDKKADKAGAKKAGTTVAVFEKSKVDDKEDRANLAKINKARGFKRGGKICK